MRETLTLLAGLVLAALAAALVAPSFIDWSAHRDALAARIAAATGGTASIEGPVSLRLLPSPRIALGRVRIAAPGFSLDAHGAEAEVASAPLLRGVVSVTSATLDQPVVEIDAAALAGASAAPAPAIGVDRLELRDARLLLRGAHALSLDHVDLVASAESARGPFRGEGFARLGARVLPFHVATGAIEAGGLAVKAEVEPLAGAPRAEANGSVRFERDGPVFEGAVAIEGDVGGARRGTFAPMPWRATFKARAGPGGGAFRDLALRAGDDAHALAAAGEGALDADGRVRLTLRATRGDVDAFLAAYDPARLQAALAGAQAATTLDLAAQDMIAGGEPANGALRLETAPGRPAALRASVEATRGGQATFDGALGASLTGSLRLRTQDAPAFSRWVAAVTGAAPIAPPFDALDASAAIEATATTLSLAELDARFDRSRVLGRVDYARGPGGPKLTADLRAPTLDVDALPDLATLRSAARGLDFAVSLDANAARFGLGRTMAQTGRLSLKVSRVGDALALDRLSLDDFGGAAVQATGAATADAGHVDATLDAKRLAELAALARRIAPDLVDESLVRRAEAFSPARATLRLDASLAGGVATPTRVAIAGRAAATSVKADLAPAGDGVSGALTLDAPEAAALLRQFGLSPGPSRGPAQIAMRASGPLSALATQADVTLAASGFRFDGVARLRPAWSLAGDLRLKSADPSPMLRLLAAPLADRFARQPVDLRARVEADGDRLAAHDIAGAVAGVTVSGDLAQRDGVIEGALRLDRLDAGVLAALALGAPQPAAAPFAPQPIDAPPARIDLAVGDLALGALRAADARARVTLGPGLVEAEGASMRLAGGTVGGDLALRRQGGVASLRGRMRAQDVAVDVGWAKGAAAGALEFAGAGASPAALLGSLSGKGTLKLAALSIARADAGAPGRVAADVDAERIPVDPAAIEAALRRELDAAPFAAPALESAVALGAGKAAFSPDGAGFAATLDLAAGLVEARATLESAPPADWDGATPSVDLSWSGPWRAPARAVEATGLVRTLAAHALGREQARIAALEADQRERSFFNRRLRFDRRLEADRKAEAARQEILRQEAAREALRQEAAREAARLEAARKAEEARRADDARRAEEARRKADDAPEAPPPARAPIAAPVPPGAAPPDPSAAGRY